MAYHSFMQANSIKKLKYTFAKHLVLQTKLIDSPIGRIGEEELKLYLF